MRKKLITLFLSTFYISAFTFGGGYVILPLMKEKFVGELGWVEEDEMLDLIAIAQSSPGAMAVNISILVGYKVAGVFGSVVVVIATLLPPIIIISIIAHFYNLLKSNIYVGYFLKSMGAVVSAVIFTVVYDLIVKIVNTKNIILIALVVISLIAKIVFNVNVLLILVFCALVGLLTMFGDKRGQDAD